MCVLQVTCRKPLAAALVVAIAATSIGSLYFPKSAPPKSGLPTTEAQPNSAERISLNTLEVIMPSLSAFNPVDVNKHHEVLVLDLCHSRLLFVDGAHDRLAPGLALGWEKSKDNTEWTFHLGTAKTPDGDEVTSADVAFSVGLYLNEKFESTQRTNFEFGGKAVEVTAPGPKTVKFRTAAPAPYLDWLLAGLTILPQQTFGPLAADPVQFRSALGEKADPKLVRGWGPYQMEKRTNTELELVRNPNFGGDKQGPLPRIERMRFTLIDDPTTAKIKFMNDSRYPFRVPDPIEAREYDGQSKFNLMDLGVGGWTAQTWVNQNAGTPLPPGKAALFQNVEFRRALAYAINRQEIIDVAFAGHAEPLYGPISPAYSWAVPSQELAAIAPTFNPNKARSELARLGLKLGTNGMWEYQEQGQWTPLSLPIFVTPSPGDVRKVMTEVLVEQFRAVGIDASVDVIPFNDAVKRILKTKDYTALHIWAEGYTHPVLAGELIQSKSPMHYFGKQDKPAPWEVENDQLFDVFSADSDPQKAQETLQQIQRNWVNNQPFFHLVAPRALLVTRTTVHFEGLAETGRASHPVLARPQVEQLRITQVPKVK